MAEAVDVRPLPTVVRAKVPGGILNDIEAARSPLTASELVRLKTSKALGISFPLTLLGSAYKGIE